MSEATEQTTASAEEVAASARSLATGTPPRRSGARYRTPKTRPPAALRGGPPADEVEAAIVAVAQANQTHGYRMVTALVMRDLGRAVNRKRVLAALCAVVLPSRTSERLGRVLL